jgi:cobalt/nickel transport protein
MGLKRALTLAVLGVGLSSWAHFLTLIPDSDIKERSREVKLRCEFTHPAEGGPAMPFRIEEGGAFVGGKVYPLRWEPVSEGAKGYAATFKIFRPGVYQFFVKQEPYFEPAEERFIQQIAKVYTCAFNLEEGWDKPIGLRVEIVPITRPFGLWEGNTFKGRVLINGKPAAGVEVEVEYYNTEGLKYPKTPLITQVVKTDEDGYFVYTIPWSGWWGFSAITDGGTLKNPSDGKDYPLELDAVLWIYAYPKPSKK